MPTELLPNVPKNHPSLTQNLSSRQLFLSVIRIMENQNRYTNKTKEEDPVFTPLPEIFSCMRCF